MAERRTKDTKEPLASLARERGLRGVGGKDIQRKLGLSETEALADCQALEEEGRVLILSFSPLKVVSQESLDLLREKVAAAVGRFHDKNPAEPGITLEKLRKKFSVSRRVLVLVLRSLLREGSIKEGGGAYALPSFDPALTPREEKMLARLEDICLKGRLSAASLQEVKKELGITEPGLEKLLSVLVDRRKVVRGDEGFFLHRQWLDEMVAKVRRLGKNEMTVADFKALTGLSRKYAIPLLELLDQMGVTRRKGSKREIL